MSPDAIEEAAALLTAARLGHSCLGRDLPASCRPTSSEDAYSIQNAVVRKLGLEVVGWKTGAASPVATPSAAPLLDGTVFRSPAMLRGVQYRTFGIEAELAYIFGADMPRRDKPYVEDDLLGAVEAIVAVLEEVETRFSKFQAQEKFSQLADFQNNGALIYGTPIKDWQSLDPLTIRARVLIDDKTVAESHGDFRAGHPLRPLLWLVNHCADHRGGIQAGQIVTTGTLTGITFAKPGAKVSAEFERLGGVDLRIDVG